jgi:hypothetical protein
MRTLAGLSLAIATAVSAFGQPNTSCENNLQCIVYSFTGVLGPVQSGPDALGLSGQTFSVVGRVSPLKKPSRSWKDGAEFSLSSGDGVTVFAIIGGVTYMASSVWKLEVGIGSAYDEVKLYGEISGGIVLSATGYIEPGSWPDGSLLLPKRFSPSPQNLVPPMNYVRYSPPGGKLTTLGFAGVTQVNVPPPDQR